MEFLSLFLLCICVLVLLLNVTNFTRCSYDYGRCRLRGPTGLPIFGNMYSLLREYKAPMTLYTKWARRFGAMYKIRVGNQMAVVLNDVSSFNRIFGPKLGHKCHYRPRGTVLSMILGNKGLVTSDGPTWREHRAFTLKAFNQNLKLGKSSQHSSLYPQVEELIKKLKQGVLHSSSRMSKNQVGDAEVLFDPTQDIGLCIFNTMWNFFGSQNIVQEQKQQNNIRKFFSESPAEMQVAEMSGVWNFSLVLQLFWILWINPVKLLVSTVRKSLFIRSEIAKNQSLLLLASLPRDQSQEKNVLASSDESVSMQANFTRLYLQEMSDPETKFATFARSQLRATLFDLIAAGVDTTFTTIQWILLLLAKHPTALRKLQYQLDMALTCKSLCELSSYASRCDVPYLQAVILETFRFRPTIHSICHTTRQDINFDTDQKGHQIIIPKHSWIIGNIWGVHHDVSVWEKPDKFIPERFILPSNQINKELAEKIIPFSSGIRSCPGELFSKVSLHAFLVAILSEFDVQLHPKYQEVSIEPIVAVSLIPPPHLLTFHVRQHLSK